MLTGTEINNVVQCAKSKPKGHFPSLVRPFRAVACNTLHKYARILVTEIAPGLFCKTKLCR